MDISTAMLLWATEGTTLAVLMVAAWLHDRSQTVTGLWGLGFGMHGLGIALVGLRGVIPDSISIVVGNGLVLFGIVCWSIGILAYDGKRPHIWLAIPLALWLAMLCVPSIMAHFWARTVTFQLCASLAYLMLAYYVLKGGPDSRLARLSFAGVVWIQAGSMIKMAFDAYRFRPDGFAQMPNVTTFAVSNIFCLVAGILLGARLLMARAEQRLHKLAISDPLTGALNRRGLLDRFNDMCRRAPPAKPLMALVIFDLDHFKQINDRYGHSMGDKVLVAFCRVAQACLGERGTFGRMGGEEFACLMHVSGAAEASGITEAIRLTLKHQETAVQGTDQTICVTVSAGISVSPVSKADLDQMLLIADRALYAAKAAGRNRAALASGAESDIAIIAGSDRSPAPDSLQGTETLARGQVVPLAGGRA
ncbi:GGDEF domain-containing protein [Rhizobium sp. FY34]|uniref:GGDEF domain-containing protein n=1 Tax=Rhizobium sp. FY34 TaxID=2562309 RepID=UPI001485142B|nr:GGDEF domain-containing protein [Rhizobium sp. FY34]